MGELCAVVRRVGMDEEILQLEYWEGDSNYHQLGGETAGNGEVVKVQDNGESYKGKNPHKSYRSDLTFIYL